MASTSFLPTFDPFSAMKWRPARKGTARISAVGRDSRGRNRMVDESMIVLRKRIHEIKMADTELPREWMDWEKRVYLSYDAIICDAVGHLQSYFMETRPSLALAVALLLALSVLTSTALLVYNFLPLLSGIHLHM